MTTCPCAKRAAGEATPATLRQANGWPTPSTANGKDGRAAGVAALLLRRQPAVALFCATEQELARKCKGAMTQVSVHERAQPPSRAATQATRASSSAPRIHDRPSEDRSSQQPAAEPGEPAGQKAVTCAHSLQLASSDLSPRAGPAVPAAGSAQS